MEDKDMLEVRDGGAICGGKMEIRYLCARPVRGAGRCLMRVHRHRVGLGGVKSRACHYHITLR